MKREISCRLDGTDVIQTTKVTDDKGELVSKTASRLGDRDAVLEQIDGQLSEAKRDLDGITSPKTTEPAAAADGVPGEEVVFWVSGKKLFRVTILRNDKGKVVSERTDPQGEWKSRIANAEERHAEIKQLRDAIAAAK